MNISFGHLMIMIFCCLIWSGTFIAGKVSLSEFPPILFASLRYIALTAFLFPFLRIHKQRMALIIAIALSTGALHIMFFYIGLSLAHNVSVVAIATQMEVPFAMLLSMMFLGERIGWRRQVGFVLCMSGILLINFDPALFDERAGLIFVLISAFAGALGTIFLRLLNDVKIFDLLAWVALISAIILSCFSLLFESDHIAKITQASWSAWAGLFYTAFCANLIAYGLFYYLLRFYEVSLLALLLTLVPVFAVILGVQIYGDILTERIMIGGLTILLGTLVIIERNKEKKQIPNV